MRVDFFLDVYVQAWGRSLATINLFANVATPRVLIHKRNTNSSTFNLLVSVFRNLNPAPLERVFSVVLEELTLLPSTHVSV